MLGELKNVFRPEFLNRVDDIIVFNKLNKDEIKQIASKMLDTLAKRLENIEIKISFTDEAVSAISDKGFDDTYGARPLRRAIQSEIEDSSARKSSRAKSKRAHRLSATIKTASLCSIKNKKQYFNSVPYFRSAVLTVEKVQTRFVQDNI